MKHALRGNVSVGASCPGCNKPISAQLTVTKYVSSFNDLSGMVAGLTKSGLSIDAHGFALTEVWPKPPEPRLPNHLPPSVEGFFLQGESNFAQGHTDAAGLMYGRALEIAIKIVFPSVSGTLFERINKLVKNHDLPPAIGEWAHEVRIIRNGAAHDTESLSVEDMTATRNFVDAVLRYAISLPKEIELRRAATARAEVEEPTVAAQ